jgi:PAS domain-containing protein
MDDKSKGRLPVGSEKEPDAPEEKAANQGFDIRDLQSIIAGNGIFGRIIDSFPYPIAIFTTQYTLAMANRAFEEITQTEPASPGKEPTRILRHRIDDARLAAALSKVFKGDSFFLEDIYDPFSIFSWYSEQCTALPGRIYKVVVFPIPAGEAETTHGVIVFM